MIAASNTPGGAYTYDPQVEPYVKLMQISSDQTRLKRETFGCSVPCGSCKSCGFHIIFAVLWNN